MSLLLFGFLPSCKILLLRQGTKSMPDSGFKLVPTGFTTATDMHLKRSQLIQITTGWYKN